MNTTEQETVEIATATVRKETHKTINFNNLAESKRTVVYLNPKLIQIKEGFNVRQDFGDIKELENSIEANGLFKPLDIFQENGEIYLLDGHRRFTAIQNLLARGVEIQSVPCLPEQKGINDETRLIRMFISSEGKSLTVLEQATIVERLSNLGFTPQQIAIKLAKSQASISNLKQLISMPKEVINAVESGVVSASFAIDLNRKCDGNKEKLKEKLKEARAMAGTVGKTKVTKKSAKGQTGKAKKGDKFKVLIALLNQAIEALTSGDVEQQMKSVESLESYRDGLSVAV